MNLIKMQLVRISYKFKRLDRVERTKKLYNLDAFLSVGYRIQSNVATRFRQWATKQLKEYIIKCKRIIKLYTGYSNHIPTHQCHGHVTKLRSVTLPSVIFSAYSPSIAMSCARRTPIAR